MKSPGSDRVRGSLGCYPSAFKSGVLKAKPAKGVAVHSISLWLAAWLVPTGICAAAPASRGLATRRDLYTGPVESPCAHPFALGCTCAAKSSLAFKLRLADRRNGPKEHAAKGSYSCMLAASRMSRSHNLRARYSAAKFARFRAFAMLGQSLQQFLGLTHAFA